MVKYTIAAFVFLGLGAANKLIGDGQSFGDCLIIASVYVVGSWLYADNK